MTERLSGISISPTKAPGVGLRPGGFSFGPRVEAPRSFSPIKIIRISPDTYKPRSNFDLKSAPKLTFKDIKIPVNEGPVRSNLKEMQVVYQRPIEWLKPGIKKIDIKAQNIKIEQTETSPKRASPVLPEIKGRERLQVIKVGKTEIKIPQNKIEPGVEAQQLAKIEKTVVNLTETVKQTEKAEKTEIQPQEKETPQTEVLPELAQALKTVEALKETGMEEEQAEKTMDEVLQAKGSSLVELKKAGQNKKAEKEEEGEEVVLEEEQELFINLDEVAFKNRQVMMVEGFKILQGSGVEEVSGETLASLIPDKDPALDSRLVAGNRQKIDGSLMGFKRSFVGRAFYSEEELISTISQANQANRPGKLSLAPENILAQGEIEKILNGSLA